MWHAVYLKTYLNDEDGSRDFWQLNLYDNSADAKANSAKQHGVSITSDAAWTVKNIAECEGTMEEATNSYIDAR